VRNLRRHFLLDPGVVFLNHGSFGACPLRVLEACRDWQRELERQPVEFMGRRCPGLLKEARDTLAARVGARGDDLVYVSNATTGLNIVARSLSLAPGDEVLSTDHEYGALDRAWDLICRRRGARYLRRPLDLPFASHEDAVEALWAGVGERTRVLFVSHITSSTGVILPVREFARRARERGLISVVDGAHAPGQIPVDLQELGADFYAANCHKWLMAPKGAGFLHARPEMQELLQPLVISWGGDGDQPSPSRFIGDHEYLGTRDPSPWLAVPEAIRFQEEHDWDGVRDECHELLRVCRRGMEELTGLPPPVPDERSWYAQMASFPLPSCDGWELQRRLLEEFSVEVPVFYWRGRCYLRVSIQGYNEPADVEALLAALRALLPEMCDAYKGKGSDS